MTEWEYTHVRATVGIRDYSFENIYDRSVHAVYHVNGEKLELKVDDPYRTDIQDSVVAMLNKLGSNGWELVSHNERIIDAGFLSGPTEYTFFLKRARQSAP